MRLQYQFAVLSFCPDLTDPKAKSEPVAVVGMGKLGPDNFWFCVIRSQPADHLAVEDDEWAKAILNDLPSLLQHQINEASRNVAPTSFFLWLHERFRNSLHVSTVSEQSSIDFSLEHPGIFAELMASIGEWAT